MNDARFLIAAAILLLVVSVIFARGIKDTAPAVKAVRITGTVRLVGTAILPEIIITTPEGEWYIEIGEAEKLHSLQHRTVTVEGNETIIQLTFAGGFPAGNRHVLSNVTVLKVE